MKRVSWTLCWLTVAAPAAWSQGAAATAATVYRCPGPPILYTDQITPQEAKEFGLIDDVLENRPVPTTIQAAAS